MGNEKENIKAKPDLGVSEPRHEDQDKEYGPDVFDSKKSLINLTGCWFVNFGLDTLQGNMEGSRILTLNGNFDPDDLIDILTDAIYRDLPDNAKKFIDNSGQRVVIRAFNRI